MSLQQKAYIQIKQKHLISDCIKLEIKNKAASKIQKWYRVHLRFLRSYVKTWIRILLKDSWLNLYFMDCILIIKIDITSSGCIIIMHYELRYIMHKMSQYILYNNSPELNITADQVQKILTVLTKDQLIYIGFGLDET